MFDVEEDQQVGRHSWCCPGTVVWPGGMGHLCQGMGCSRVVIRVLSCHDAFAFVGLWSGLRTV